MDTGDRAARYAALWAFGLAFGWIEAATVFYLFAVHAPHGPYVGGLEYPLDVLPTRLLVAEVVREACTLIVLGAAGWLAGRRWATRVGAFLLLFGIWDLVYYVGLRLVTGWPQSLATWDVLFLIPLPWVAPVWAPALVAVVFVAVGSYLFWTANRPRAYGWIDAGALIVSALLVVVAFLADWPLVADRTLPHRFPRWLFWAGVAGSVGWFLRAEQRRTRAEVSPDAP